MSSNEYVVRSCPICNSDNAELEMVAPIVAENLEFQRVEEYWRGFSKESCFFSYYRCNICGLLYNKIYFSRNQLELLYSHMDDNSTGLDSENLEQTQEGYYRFFSKIIEKSKNRKKNHYLEVGPDTGILASIAQKIDNYNLMTLVEPNLKIHDQIRIKLNSFPSLHFEVLNSVLELNNKAKIDNIAAVHVFDHLIDPIDFLKILSHHSASNSFLLSVTHNEKSFLRYVLGKKWPPFCLQHPQLFNKKTLEKYFLTLDFKPLMIKNSTNWMPLSHLINLGFILLFGRKFDSIDKINVSLPIKLGNMQGVFFQNHSSIVE